MATDLETTVLRFFAIPPDIPWQELNKRYFGYAASLSPPLNMLAVDCQLFTGKGVSIELNSLAEVHPLVTCLPWLFNEAFPTVSYEELLNITEAGNCLFMAMLLFDAYQDCQLITHPAIPLLHQHLTVAAIDKLHSLFEARSPFWAYFNNYFHQYTEAMLLEREHWGQVKVYPLNLMYKIGSGKVALFKTVTTALALKGRGEKYITQIERAIDLLAAAMQLGDDIGDWTEDYLRQNYTLPLTYAIPVESWPVPDLTVEEVSQQFESSVVLEKLIIQMIEWFQLALDAVGELTCPHWIAFVESCLTLTRNYRESFVARKLFRVLNSTLSMSSIFSFD